MLRQWSLTTVLALAVVAAPLSAQQLSDSTTSHSDVRVDARELLVVPNIVGERTLLVAPARVNAAADAHARSTDMVPTRAVMSSSEGSRNPAMMIVGGAAILVGAIVGGSGGGAIAVGGGVLGLVGLWNYLK